MWLPKVWYLSFFSGLVFLGPYVNLYYSHRGLSKYQIGWLAGLRPWLGASSSIFWSGVADRYNCRRLVMMASLMVTLVLRELQAGMSTFPQFLVATIITESISTPVGVMADASVVAACHKEGDYGKYRLWGAVGWGVFSTVSGILITQYGIYLAFIGYAIMSSPCLVLGWYFKHPQKGIKGQAQEDDVTDKGWKVADEESGKDIQLSHWQDKQAEGKRVNIKVEASIMESSTEVLLKKENEEAADDEVEHDIESGRETGPEEVPRPQGIKRTWWGENEGESPDPMEPPGAPGVLMENSDIVEGIGLVRTHQDQHDPVRRSTCSPIIHPLGTGGVASRPGQTSGSNQEPAASPAFGGGMGDDRGREAALIQLRLLDPSPDNKVKDEERRNTDPPECPYHHHYRQDSPVVMSASRVDEGLGDEEGDLKMVDHCQSSKNSRFWKDLQQLLSSSDVLIFMWKATVMGFGIGVIEGYLFLFLEQLGGSATLMGLTLTITCVAEVPAFHYQGYLLERLGVPVMLHIVLWTYIVRLLCYSALPWWGTPWAVLPVELLHGITFACAWGAGTIHCKRLAPEGLEATMQGIFQGLYFGVGQGLGGLIGGQLMGWLGGQSLFAVAAGFVFVGWSAAAVAGSWKEIVTGTGRWLDRPYRSLPVNDDSECESKTVAMHEL